VSQPPTQPEELHPRVRQRLEDLLDQAATAVRLVARGRAAYDADEMLRLAAESLLIRMGECVERIDKADPDFVAAHPKLELRQVKDMRNLLAHGDDIVDYALVWSILQANIPVVADKVRRLLESVPATPQAATRSVWLKSSPTKSSG